MATPVGDFPTGIVLRTLLLAMSMRATRSPKAAAGPAPLGDRLGSSFVPPPAKRTTAPTTSAITRRPATAIRTGVSVGRRVGGDVGAVRGGLVLPTVAKA